jgi:hypothetical protein
MRGVSVPPRPLTIEELERWVAFGAGWRAVHIEDDRAVVELCQCTGELVECRPVLDRDVIAYLRAHLPDP